MEGQGKRLLLAVALALGVMLAWNMLFPSKEEPKKKPVATATGSGSGSGSGSTGADAKAPVEVGAPCVGEEIAFPFEKKFTATLSECGAALVGWQLADPRFAGDATKGQLLAYGIPDAGSFLISFPRSQIDVSHREKWTLVSRTDTEAVFSLTTPYLELKKTYTFAPANYLVRMNVAVKATKVASDQTVAVSVFAFQNPKADVEGSSQIAARAWSSSTLRSDGEHTVATNLKDLIVSARHEPAIRFTGFEHPYLLAAYAPKRDGKTVEKWSYAIQPEGLMRTDIVFPSEKLEVGAVLNREVVAYLGPRLYKELQAAEAITGFSPGPGFHTIVDWGWFGIIGRPLHWLLLQLQGLVGNWGLAIMLLTFIVKLVTLYPVTRSMRSMKAMAALAPKMKELQEKYKDDKQRQQAETMALYKQHGVNPIAGCLPMLMQMPVWVALYRMLSNAGELYREPFINGWISDLTAPDPYHILPVVLTVTMFIQARLTPATGTSGQQKMLQYGMPLGFGVMSFFFPAGLTIYIFTNTVLGALHSIYMNKYDRKSKELVAKMQAGMAATVESKDKEAKKSAAKPVIDAEAVEKTAPADADAPKPKRPNAGGGGSKKKRR